MIKQAVLIGYGYWGKNIARNISQSTDFNLFAVVEKDENLRKQAKEIYPHIHTFTTIDSYLSGKFVAQVGFIATAASSHFEISKILLESGHHLWVEKPMTLKISEGLEIKSLAERFDKTVIVDHTYLYSSAIKRISREIENLGDVLSVNSVRNGFGKVQQDTDVLWDLAVHDVAILEVLIHQQAVNVQAIALTKHLEKVTSLQLVIHYEKSIASVNCSWLSPIKIRDFFVLCEKGSAFFDELDVAEKVKIIKQHVEINNSSDGKNLVNYRLGDTFIPEIPNEESLTLALQDFSKSISDGLMPVSNIDLSLRVISILEAASKSLINDGRKEAVNYASSI